MKSKGLNEAGDLDFDPPKQLDARWLAGSTALGIVFIVMAVVTDVVWDWKDIWPSVLLELGAGAGLAALLFLFERRFERVVSGVVPLCTLDHPPEPVRSGTLYGGGHIFLCDHVPSHRWDEHGRRREDLEKNPAIRPDDRPS